MRLALLSTVAERAACVMICVMLVTASAHASPSASKPKDALFSQTRPTYFNGKVIEMKYSRGSHDFKIGSWNILAHVLHEKPRDPHPNLYIVAPGTQYTSDGAGQFDHNEIISTLPLKSEPIEWDVYYAVVLDPSLQENFRSERQLILATQNEFAPGENFTFEDIPGAAFLKRYLHIDSIEGLQPYRRSADKLPRLVIVPAKITVKAAAIEPETKPEPETTPEPEPSATKAAQPATSSAALPQ